MYLYKETNVESYRHPCFFQKMLIESDRARLLYLQEKYREEVIDSYVSNKDDYINFAKGQSYSAYMVAITKNGESPNHYATNYTIDILQYFFSIRMEFRKIFNILKSKDIEENCIETDEFSQFRYLINHDHPMPHIEPCEVVKEVILLHDHYISSDEIGIAYLYDKYIRTDSVINECINGISQDCIDILKQGTKDIIKELGYLDEDLSWIEECYEYQLLKIFDFPWKNQIPSYEDIKYRLTSQ